MSNNKAHLFTRRKHFLKKDFTPKDILVLIKNHKINRAGYQTLFDYYIGKHDILFRTFKDGSKPKYFNGLLLR